MTQSLPLSEQVVLITGASTGIGAALARRLATKFPGISLVLAARSRERLEAVAADCREAGACVLVVPTDMARVEQVKALAQAALDRFARVDAVVNNAGYGQMGPVELISPEAAQRQFAVNFHGPLILTQSLIPGMRDRGVGRIINISSLGGRLAFPAGGMYSASKFALEALTDVLRMELGGFGIKVSAIEPGPVKTEFFGVAGDKVEFSIPDERKKLYRPAIEAVKEIDQRTARLAWSPERVADTIIRALRARHPRPRYIAATGGRIMLFMMTKLMPRWLVDWFWKRFYSIDQVTKDWQRRTTGIEEPMS
jgi:short-subunit dehydrogenase